MEKKVWIALAALLASAALFGGTITVIQPSGGSVTMGCPVQIVWTASNVAANVKIQLIKPGGAVVELLANNLGAGSSPFSWTVAAPAVAGEQYKIRVRAVDGSAEGASAAFTVVQGDAPPPPPPPPSAVTLTLGFPNGGESWMLGREHAISWTSTNLIGKVQLDLMIYKSETQQWMIGVIKDNLPATGSYTWKAGEYQGQTAGAGQYKIRVRSMTSNHYSDSSDAPFNLSSMTKQFKKTFNKLVALQPFDAVPGVYQNYSGRDTFPANVPGIPASVYQGVWNQITPDVCYTGGGNYTALAGIYWFPYLNVQVAVVYRSRIIFYLSEHVKPGATLESAKLKMKRIHSIHEDANSGCGCSEDLWVLEAPMTSFAHPAIGQRIDVDMGAAEFTRDVTEIVKKWLDGTVVNNGLLLLAGESPCSGGRKCFSCYEAKLFLYWK